METRTFRRLDPEPQVAILSAILDEAVEKGPTSLHIKQVAERVRVYVGSLDNCSGSRDGLLAFAVELCARSVSDTVGSFRPYLLPPPLREALAAYLAGPSGFSRGRLQEVQHCRFQPLVRNRALWPDQGIEHQTVYQGCKGYCQCFRIDGRNLTSVYPFLDDAAQ